MRHRPRLGLTSRLALLVALGVATQATAARGQGAQGSVATTTTPAAPEASSTKAAPASAPASGEAGDPAPPLRPTIDAAPDPSRPPPLHVEYVQYGVAVAVEMNISAGATCPENVRTPCILGSGGGLALRLGYRAPGPWYVGGAYEFVKMDSSNLYRLGIFQQVRAELRYLPDIGLRAAPFVTVGLGGMAYGNEWGVETGGGLVFAGAGVEIEVSRTALLGMNFVYRPVLVAPWRDTAGQQRDLGVAQFIGFDFLLEIRTEIGRR